MAEPARAVDLSSISSDPSYVPASKRSASSSSVSSWFAKTFKIKSSAAEAPAAADESASDHPKGAIGGGTSFAFWKKTGGHGHTHSHSHPHKSTASAPPPATAAITAAAAAIPAPSPSSQSSSSISGVLYRPERSSSSSSSGPVYDPSAAAAAAADSVDGLHPAPAHARSATTGPSFSPSQLHALPHSRSDSAFAASASSDGGMPEGAHSSLGGGGGVTMRDRSASNVTSSSSSSYYNSTYYSNALSSLTAFQPSSATFERERRQSAAGSPPLHPQVDEPARSISPTHSDAAEQPQQRPRTSSVATAAGTARHAAAASAAGSQPQSATAAPATGASSKSHQLKVSNFRRLLLEDSLDLSALRRMAWASIPVSVRSVVWKVLLGYLPHVRGRRLATLKKRREEYREYVQMYYPESTADEMATAAAAAAATAAASGTPLSAASSSSLPPPNVVRSESDNDILHQIKQDVPRTAPGIPFFKRPRSQKSLERMLYIFAVRHPASGYVQGMSDVSTPFYVVFLSEYLYPNAVSSATSTCSWAGGAPPSPDADAPPPPIVVDTPINGAGGNIGGSGGGQLNGEGLGVLSESVDAELGDSVGAGAGLSLEDYLDLESDVFWCLSRLLDRIQDNFTFAQPGIQRMVYRLRELTSRIDAPLHSHLEAQHVQYMHFAFRWINCLLLRELPMRCILRLWDTYLAEDSAATAATGAGSNLTGTGGSGNNNSNSSSSNNAAQAQPNSASATSSDVVSGSGNNAGGAGASAVVGSGGNVSGLVVSPQDLYTGFRSFHIYVCCAFLLRFSPELRRLDFQDLVLFLQKLPTDRWTEKEVDTLVAQAFIYKSCFHASPHQLK